MKLPIIETPLFVNRNNQPVKENRNINVKKMLGHQNETEEVLTE